MAQATLPLTHEITALRAIAGGAPEGKSWKEDLDQSEFDTFKAFLSKINDTILKAEKSKLVAVTLSCHKAFVNLHKMHALFHSTTPEDLNKECSELTKLARTTTSEYMFLEALVKSKTDPEKAILEINKTITSMGAMPDEKDKIKVTDIYPYLLQQCNIVTSGGKVW